MWNYLLEKGETLDLLGSREVPTESPPFIMFGKFGSEAHNPLPPFHSIDDCETKILQDVGKSMGTFNLPFYEKNVFKVDKYRTRKFFPFLFIESKDERHGNWAGNECLQ